MQYLLYVLMLRSVQEEKLPFFLGMKNLKTSTLDGVHIFTIFTRYNNHAIYIRKVIVVYISHI